MLAPFLIGMLTGVFMAVIYSYVRYYIQKRNQREAGKVLHKWKHAGVYTYACARCDYVTTAINAGELPIWGCSGSPKEPKQ